MVTHERAPVLLAGTGWRRQRPPVALDQPVRARQHQRAAPSWADLADEREQFDGRYRPGRMVETAVHVPAVRQDPRVRLGEGEQDLGARTRTAPAAGSEVHV